MLSKTMLWDQFFRLDGALNDGLGEGVMPHASIQTPSTGLRHPSFNHCRI